MGQCDAPECVGYDENDELTGDVEIYGGKKNMKGQIQIWPINTYSEGLLKIDIYDQNEKEKASILLTKKGVKELKRAIRVAERAER